MKDNFDNSFDEKMFSDAWEKKKKARDTARGSDYRNPSISNYRAFRSTV